MQWCKLLFLASLVWSYVSLLELYSHSNPHHWVGIFLMLLWPKIPFVVPREAPLEQFRGQASHSRTLQQFVVLRQHVWDSGYRSSTVWSHKDAIVHADKASINIHVTTNGHILIAIQSAMSYLPLNMHVHVCMWDYDLLSQPVERFHKTKVKGILKIFNFFHISRFSTFMPFGHVVTSLIKYWRKDWRWCCMWELANCPQRDYEIVLWRVGLACCCESGGHMGAIFFFHFEQGCEAANDYLAHLFTKVSI